jgi:hypothetical protein
MSNSNFIDVRGIVIISAAALEVLATAGITPPKSPSSRGDFDSFEVPSSLGLVYRPGNPSVMGRLLTSEEAN